MRASKPTPATLKNSEPCRSPASIARVIAGRGDREGRSGIEWDHEIARQAVARPAGNDRERNAGARDSRRRPVHGAVAAPRDDEVDAVVAAASLAKAIRIVRAGRDADLGVVVVGGREWTVARSTHAPIVLRAARTGDRVDDDERALQASRRERAQRLRRQHPAQRARARPAWRRRRRSGTPRPS